MKYHVESSIVIDAPLKKVRSLVEDFNQWNSWSPWTIAEPELKPIIEGKVGEAGHKMTWDGAIIGSGTNTISATSPDSISYDLEFIKPFKSSAKTRFDFKAVEGGVKVTWLMDSSLPFFMFFMVKTMKSWIEMDYERGLKMLKSIAEDGKINAKTTNKGTKEFKGFSYVGIKKTSTVAEMPKDMGAAFKELIDFVVVKNGKSAQHWISVYVKVNMGEKRFTYVAAVSDEELEGIELPEHFVRGKIKDGKKLEIKHDGSYDFLGNAWSMGSMYVRAKKIGRRGKPFEYYWNSPYDVPEDKLETSIFFNVK